MNPASDAQRARAIAETQLVCAGCGRRKWVKHDPPTVAEHHRLLAWWRSVGRRCKECRAGR